MRWLLLAAAILVTNFGVYAFAKVNTDAISAIKPPKLLSEYGLFSDMAKFEPETGVVPYSLITQLFSDYAVKSRHIFVPSGKSARYVVDEVFEFPVGTVLIKTFSMPVDLRQPEANQRIIETRLLIHQTDGWKAHAYVWNKNKTDAVLKIAGKRLSLPLVTKSGDEISLSYKVPNKNQCKGCHALNGDIVPIGPKARNLNREVEHAGANGNQLKFWQHKAILSGLPELETVPKIADWRDNSAELDLRARAYLDVNCAHCHRRQGPASNSGLFLTYGEKSKTLWGYKKRPVAAGRGSGGLTFDIDPGNPDKSILIYRLKNSDPGVMMPELGRSLINSEAVEMLSRWITEMR